MLRTTTVRLSKKTKAKLERISSITGMNLSKALDFAVEAAEHRVEEYHGNVDSLLKLKVAKSGYAHTSEQADKIAAQESKNRR